MCIFNLYMYDSTRRMIISGNWVRYSVFKTTYILGFDQHIETKCARFDQILQLRKRSPPYNIILFQT